LFDLAIFIEKTAHSPHDTHKIDVNAPTKKLFLLILGKNTTVGAKSCKFTTIAEALERQVG
jgi:hypothetical protein